MKRRIDRACAFKLIFQLEFHEKVDAKKQFELYFESDEEAAKADKDFVALLFNGVLENLTKIDELIAKFSEGWSLSRISKANLAILRTAVFEILYSDTPEKVAANEAVELSKKFSSEESNSFINGILGNIIDYKHQGEA